MSTASTERNAAVAEPAPATEARPEERTKTRRQPPYAVVLHNDDLNGFGFVVDVLCKVFRYARPRSYLLTLTAHLKGRSVVWTGPLEVAELKADQVRSCGADPEQKSRGALPLRVTVEPLAD
jgi:ATP-dependent Clp protease adaptor protein ClpS